MSAPRERCAARPTTHPDGTPARFERDEGGYVTCPWCGQGGMEPGVDGAHPCTKCGRHIDVEVEVEVTYSFRPIVTIDEILAQPEVSS